MSARSRKRTEALVEWWESYAWAFWTTAVGVTVVLGYIGFREHFEASDGKSDADLLYLSLQLFVLESGDVTPPVPWELQVARIAAPALAGVGLVGAINAIRHALQSEARAIRRSRDHVIVCGLGRRGAALTESLREDSQRPKARVIAIDKEPDPERLERCKEKGARFFQGDATDEAVLRTARLSRAKALVTLSGEDDINAEVGVVARSVVEDEERKPAIYVQLTDPELKKIVEASNGHSTVKLTLIDVFDAAAALMIAKDKRFPRAYEERERVLIVGVGKLGRRVIARLGTAWEQAERPKRLPLTLVDRGAETKLAEIMIQEPKAVDRCRLREWHHNVDGPQFDEGTFLQEGERVGAAYVCFDDDRLSVTTALTLRRLLPPESPIVVRVARAKGGLADLLPPNGQDNIFRVGIGEASNVDLLRGLPD